MVSLVSPGKTDNKVAMNLDANFTAVLHEGAGHFNGRALLDVLQNLRIAGFEAHDEETGTAIGHGLQGFVIAVNPRGARPLELQWLEFWPKLDSSVLANVEGVVVEENFLHLRESFEGVLHFVNDVVDGTGAPCVAGDGLRPHTEGALSRTPARAIEGDKGIQKERYVVTFNLEITFVNVDANGKASSSSVCNCPREALWTILPSLR